MVDLHKDISYSFSVEYFHLSWSTGQSITNGGATNTELNYVISNGDY
jgi:hypothetical protein